jgi:lipopolysaccharide export system protein LptA
MLAAFHPETSELVRLEQKSGFRYQEGDRRATSDQAALDTPRDFITLEGSARAWDPSGSVSADRIGLDQKSGDYTAEGRVASMRQPDKKARPSAMLSNDQVLQARSQRMISSANNQRIRYEGSAVAWQGPNRVEADRIEIDRQRGVLEAHGRVVSQLADKTPPGAKSKAAPPVFTVVRAPDLVYTEATRLAHYQGGASLIRPDLAVTSRELRAFLSDGTGDSSLDRSIADGAVKIVSTVPGRTRTGTAEHAEYFTGEQKVILMGGDPLLVDSKTGKTAGQQLTWWANNDRLLVNGEPARPAASTIRKK